MASDESESEAKRLWREAKAALGGAAPQRGAPATSPVRRYLDEGRHRAEVAALRRFPHAVAPAARVVAPGDWLTAELLGVPVLVVRGDDGELRAFINVCRHRGAIVAAPASAGSARSRFVCPYHSWTYDGCGRLVGRPHESDFAHLPREAAGLVALPVASRCGLVWVVAEAAPAFDWDAHFGALGAELERLGFDGKAQVAHERRFVQPSNWKLVVDANLESYHFQYAHRATIAHLFHDNVVQQESFGCNQRIVLAKRSLLETDAGEVGWDELGRHANIVYFFFPGTLMLWQGDHAIAIDVTPRTVASCAAASWMVVPAPQHAARSALHWERNWSIFWDAIDEDFALAASMQAGLASGANEALTFGANEFACDLFGRGVDALVAASDAGDQRGA